VSQALDEVSPYVKSAADTVSPYVKTAVDTVKDVAGPAFRQAQPQLQVPASEYQVRSMANHDASLAVQDADTPRVALPHAPLTVIGGAACSHR
jgi:hypothetical protein